MKRASFVASAGLVIAVLFAPSVSAAGTSLDPDQDTCAGVYSSGWCTGVDVRSGYICIGISGFTCIGVCIETRGECPIWLD